MGPRASIAVTSSRATWPGNPRGKSSPGEDGAPPSSLPWKEKGRSCSTVSSEPADILWTAARAWFCKSFNGRIPCLSDGKLVYWSTENRETSMVDLTGRGDLTKSHMRWHAKRLGRDPPSPASLDGLVFVTSMSGIITCYDSKDGKTLWVTSKGPGSPSSPTAITTSRARKGDLRGQAQPGKLQVLGKTLSPGDEEIFRHRRSTGDLHQVPVGSLLHRGLIRRTP